MLSVLRAVPTLVWGILLVGIVGLGGTAGIMAIALHSAGTYGRLFSEALDRLPPQHIESGIALGLSPRQTAFHCLRGYIIRDWGATHLYLWEYAIRDSFVLGLVGAGGIGLLISETVALFQWDRLATLLLVVIVVVWLFESLSAMGHANDSASTPTRNRHHSRRDP
jgi:ABC-type phosphate/phosphonate transport system permease subunit